MKHLFKILILAFILGIPLSSHAQKIEIGLGLGAANYRGDLSRHFHLMNSRPAGQFMVRYNLSPVWSVRGNLFAGMLGAKEKAYRQDPSPQINENFEFKSFASEFNSVIEYNFFNYRSRSVVNSTFSPYVFAGLGIAKYYDIQTPTYVDPNTDNTSGLKPTFPFGVGIKYAKGKFWCFGAEFMAKKSLTDVIDSWVANNNNDMSFFYGLTITRRFLKLKCPDIYYD